MIGPWILRWIRQWVDRLLIDPVPRHCPRCERDAGWRAVEAAETSEDVICECLRCGMRLVVTASPHHA